MIGLSSAAIRLVVLPQLVRLALPGLAKYLAAILLKDTALVSAIGLADILRRPALPPASPNKPSCFLGRLPDLSGAGHHPPSPSARSAIGLQKSKAAR